MCTHVGIFGFEVYHEYMIKYVKAVEHNSQTFKDNLIHFRCSKQFGAYCTSEVCPFLSFDGTGGSVIDYEIMI